MPDERIEIRPHKGPQEQFLSSPADIACYGGAAGGGKTRALVMEPLRYIGNPDFGAVIFRRITGSITGQGGLWDESQGIYGPLGAKSRAEPHLDWRFASGARVKFSHLQHESDKFKWHGAQIPLLCFDEAQEFSESMFWYMLSRNRSVSGVTPYVRLTCNPVPDDDPVGGWLHRLISWWIDPETGYAIEDRSGVVRWFVRLDEQLHWGDSREELIERFGPDVMPKSLSFIRARLDDNPTLEERDPGYRANLMALPTVERERLLGGNWKVRAHAGLVFPRTAWNYCDPAEVPHSVRWVRAWDKAGTEGGKGARTAGIRIGKDPDGRYYVDGGRADRWSDIERERAIKATAEQDREQLGHVETWIEREPGSGGKDSAKATVRNLSGFDVHTEAPTGDKYSRWRPLAAQVQAGNVWIVRGDWDWADYVQELDRLSGDKKQDEKVLCDYADASGLAFNKLTDSRFLNRPLLALSEDEAADLGPEPAGHREPPGLGFMEE